MSLVKESRDYTTRETCRVCGSRKLVPLFSLGSQYVSDFVADALPPTTPKVPLDLELCQHCSLVQLKHTAPQDFLYTRHYWYRSGVTATMRAQLAEVAQVAQDLVTLRPGDVVLDIGSNDGTLLRSYTATDIQRVGVEPANNLVEEGSRGIETFIHDFWSEQAYTNRVPRTKAKIITALGMFYDLEDPNQFIADIAKVLHKDGVFISQLMCLHQTVKQTDVGNFAHEHLEFYSLASLFYLFAKHGLSVVDITENTVNGGSYRIVAKKSGTRPLVRSEEAQERVRKARLQETGLADPSFYAGYFAKLEANKRATASFIRKEVEQGKSVWVYGASTKGNVLLQYYGLDGTLIQGAAERSPEKYGLYTIGTNIPIFSEAEARQANPDYFLVLPYAFIDEFVQREREWLQRGGQFIVPLPTFRTIGANNV